MIQSRTLFVLLLSACFLLLQGVIDLSYSAGVSINFSSLSVSGANTSAQTWGNNDSVVQSSNTAPTSQNTQTSSVPNNTATQNVNQNSNVSVTSASSTSSSISSSQQLQQQSSNNTTDNLFKTIEQDQTVKLTNIPNFNPLPEKESLLPSAEPYAVTVCLSYNDVSISGCADKKTPLEASEKLAAMILNKYLKGGEIRPFKVVMPSSMPPDQQIQLLRQIETDAIAIIEAGILKEGNPQKQNIIIDDVKIARQEAQSGINWSHNLKDDKSTHDFHIGKAFSQLNKILISGR